MAGYIMRTYEDRMTIQKMWNDGARATEIAEKLEIQLSSLYSELSRGRDGSRLQNQRLRYNADGSKQALLVLTERRTRMGIMVLVEDHTAASEVKAINRLERKFGKLFYTIFKAIPHRRDARRA